MIIDEIRNIKSGKRELRQFGLMFGIILSLFGGLFLLRGKDHYLYLFILSFIFLFLGLAAPAALKPIQKILMSAAILIGWLTTRLILLVLFYFVITPIGILAKLVRKSFLDTRFNKHANNYWQLRSPDKFDKKSYENQF